MWGTYRSIINNAVKGVSAGHEKILELSGVGFRANLKGDLLNLQLGFSHDINFKIQRNQNYCWKTNYYKDKRSRQRISF